MHAFEVHPPLMPTLWNSEPIAALSQLPFKNRQIAMVDAIGRKVRIEELAEADEGRAPHSNRYRRSDPGGRREDGRRQLGGVGFGVTPAKRTSNPPRL